VNDFPHVRESTRERVQEAVLQLGYRPQAAAQQLRTGASRMVTLALPSLKFTYFSDIAQEFIDEAQLRDQTVVLHSTSAGREEELCARMERTPQPTVFIGEHLPESLPAGCDYVKIDNVAAAFDMTTHLIAAGRRRLGFIGAIPSPLGRQPHSSGSLCRDGFHQ